MRGLGLVYGMFCASNDSRDCFVSCVVLWLSVARRYEPWYHSRA